MFQDNFTTIKRFNEGRKLKQIKDGVVHVISVKKDSQYIDLEFKTKVYNENYTSFTEQVARQTVTYYDFCYSFLTKVIYVTNISTLNNKDFINVYNTVRSNVLPV